MPEKEPSIFNDLGKLDNFIGNLVKARMQDRSLNYAGALLEEAQNSPHLFRLREALYRQRENESLPVERYELLQGKLVRVEEDIKGLIADVQKAHPELEYGQAMRVSLAEHPDIWQRREKLWRQVNG